MPAQLVNYTQHRTHKGDVVSDTDIQFSSNALNKIFIILRNQTRHDFSLYKKNTICRRIERRMNVLQIDNIEDYVAYMQKSEREAGVLFKELLIGVTNFFRDPKAFQFLQDQVLPVLFEKKPDNYTIRAWIPGCATGEEVYSIAILLHECMELTGRHFHIQIFGTDIDEDAINVARTGLYSDNITADVSASRLNRYFIKEQSGQYRVKKLIREMLVFAPQNIIKDPPFTKLDLLCCRNLLIYLGPELQQQLLPLFHYSMKPDGILFLGSSETIGAHRDLFELLHKKWKIFRRKTLSSTKRQMLDFSAKTQHYELQDMNESKTVEKAEELSALQLVETILRKSNTPPCVIINNACNVVYIHGRTGKFLEPAEGEANMSIIEMARNGLKVELNNAIRQVTIHKKEVAYKTLPISCNGEKLYLNLTVSPIPDQPALHGLMMVTFEETTNIAKAHDKPELTQSNIRGKKVEEIEQELQYTRENLQTSIEELETSNEELQSTNEELQSTNEELETSKEELQSLNEESATVNTELQARIDELSMTNDDMRNLLDSTNIATIFLDTDMQIRRYTPKAIDIIPLTESDTGRPIDHLASRLKDIEIIEWARLVLKDLAAREIEVESTRDRSYVMTIRPYRTLTNVIEGVVITFSDITERTRINKELQKSENRFRSYFELGLVGTAIISSDLTWIDFNDTLCHIFGYTRNELVKLTWHDLTHPDDIESEQMEFKRMLNGEANSFTLEKRFFHKNSSTLNTIISASAVRKADGSVDYLVALVDDITDRKRAEQAKAESEQRYRMLFELANDSIVLVDPKNGGFIEFNEKAHEQLNYSKEEFARLSLDEIEASETTQQIIEHLKTIVKQGNDSFKTQHKSKSGEVFPVFVKAKPITIDKKVVVLSTWQYLK